MTNFPSDSYTFGSAHYRPVIDSLQLRVPLPFAPLVAEWIHIPYGGVNVLEVDGGRLHSSWQLRIVMPTAADYAAMVAAVGSFQTLTTDFGSKTAVLRSLEGAQQHSSGYWIANVTWEWN